MHVGRSSASRLLAAAMASTIVAVLSVSNAIAGPVVTVQLHNGRILSGEVNSRTNDSELWLHSAEPSIAILTSLAWSDIVAARVGKTPIAKPDIQATLKELKGPIPVTVFQRPAEQLIPSQTPAPRVTSLDIVAKLANWDRDVESDGLEVRINPLSANGDVVAVNGMIRFRLLGRRLGSAERLESSAQHGYQNNVSSPREYAPRMNSPQYVELGVWNERLRSRDVTDSGYLVRLPFRTAHPEYDLDIALDGQIDARLSVAGQQIHEATLPIQLRPFSPLREELQLNRGTRFFHDEFRGR